MKFTEPNDSEFENTASSCYLLNLQNTTCSLAEMCMFNHAPKTDSQTLPVSASTLGTAKDDIKRLKLPFAISL